MKMTTEFRLATDTGGTFTDLIVNGNRLYKSSTTPDDPVRGILDVVAVAAADIGITTRQLLERTVQFVHGTTRATNAIINGETARTGIFLTAGHPDILLWREGGRMGTFDFSSPYPDPYVPRRLTFEVPERIGAQGEVVKPLDELAAIELIKRAEGAGVEAVAVCLLWSIINPTHEKMLGSLISSNLPGVPFTLSHELNPSIREYRRASSAAIDASLKPLMGAYLGSLGERLRAEGLPQDVLVVTAAGGVLPSADVGRIPIHSLASGPAAAPVAGRRFAAGVGSVDNVIVTDAGGTSFDVSLVRKGVIPWTRETRIGRSYLGPMTGFPSVDVKSIRRGRRQYRLDRRRRTASRRPRKRGRRAGAGVLREGWRSANGDGRLSRAWLSRSRILSGRGNDDPPGTVAQGGRDSYRDAVGHEPR
jgi:N-methylhydantoinase A